MKTRRTLPVLLLALLVILTACQTATPAPTKAPAATPAPTATPAPNLNPEGYPIVNEKITLKAFQWELDNQSIDYPNLWFYQELEKKTNVHVEFQEVKGADFNTQLNLMFASGDYADVIIRGMLPSHIEEYGVTQKILLPLDDLLPKYMPVYYERLQMNNANASIPASDGKSYYVGFLIAQNVNHVGNWFINTEWLKKVNKEVPKTIAELTDVLRAFKAQDPNGNGKPDEMPFEAYIQNANHDMTQNLLNMFASFGVAENSWYMYIDDKDKVQFTGAQAGWRACAQWLNTLYKEGLMDPESLTQDTNKWGEKMNGGLCGFTTYLRLINTALKEETYKQFKSMLPPVAEGYKAQVSRILEVPEVGAAVTKSNKNVEATLRWLDAQMEPETMMVASNGPIKAGGPIEPTIKLNADNQYEIVSVPADNGLYKYVPVTTGQFFAPGDFYFKIYKMPPHRVERYNYSQDYEKAGVLEAKSFQYLTRLSKLTNEQSTEAAKIFTDLDKLMNETLTAFITTGVTDASYQDFLTKAKGVGIDKYLQIYQAAYDAYLAANK